ncbi:MAG: hypothetical protein AUI10_09485 [Actinobacteria bacterium 13_2_20CM_2_72_6]|nr:MAG: hypothetical protein AUI10_09485 [Actinobacteria bacterium 13_2_20CM_2_72_6]
MRKRILAAVSVALLALTGCGGAPAELTTEDTSGLGLEQVKVGMAYDLGGRGDKSFNDAAGAGLDRAKKDLLVQATEVAPAQSTDDARAAKLRELAKAGHNPVIAIGFLYAAAIDTVAKEFPDKTFAIVDSTSAVPNVVSLIFAEEQGSYLVGVAAALASHSQHIGFVGGVDVPLIHKFQAGYIAGAKRVNPRIAIDSAYLTAPPDFGGFNDPGKGKAAAARMAAGGVDVVYSAAGGSGPGVMQAMAAVHGGWGIGVDSDQYQTADAATKPIVLTSMLKRVDNAVFQEIQAFIKGDRAGGLKRFDLKIDGVGYATSNESAIAPFKARIDRERQAIIDGTTVVPDH